MKKILKYTLSPECYLQIPKGGVPLFVGNQKEVAQIWFLVDPSQEKETRHFSVFPTGVELPNNVGNFGGYHYIGSFLMSGGNLVFHVFESCE
ncbi:hypothetical protein A2Z67_05110 [Candidatus Woesebacteria bacterium RBG_13_36_22]|uniref:DUF7352 domain-containing protein n=1 Tax=Candidatus Woesebacteria bacterium RBG_13_36_22 TaxID=1802478 RepID=A0A1F7X2U0_9BACT|nr:MAG: hypothetical protein A2Z67_05110 [Candidatus Woesebacteria bacterium RBG_13_36_22]